MFKSNQSKLIGLALAGVTVICLMAFCVVVVAAVIIVANQDEPVAIQETAPPITTVTVSPIDNAPTQAIVETDTPTDAPVETSAPSENNGPQPTQDTSGGQPDHGLYQHPSGAFHILPFTSQYEEGDNYTSFYNDTDIIDITEFDLDGDLIETDLYDIAGQVLDSILIETGWATSYEITSDPVEEINGGYLLHFSMPLTERGETDGALFMRQELQSLFALTWLSSDYITMEETWYRVVNSFTPGRIQTTNQPTDSSGVDSPIAETDSGFRPEVHGFSFPNYGNEDNIVNLTSEEMHRMFGDVVCASTQGGQCTLTPPAQEWMNQANSAMDGGHCEGMAVLSELFFYDHLNPAGFGSDTVYNLSFNETLAREIAYWWITQFTYPGGVTIINDSPTSVVNTLNEGLGQGKNASEWWAVGIYQRDRSGGHAVTPIAVDDKGGGLYDILIYDNNHPGQIRAIEVDTNTDTWQYQASTNPDESEALYEGDASTKTLEAVAISPRLKQQECTFCQGRGGTISGRSLTREQYYEIYLEGNADLLIEDEYGNQVGYLDGELVNNIPGAGMDTYRFGKDIWDDDYEPLYRIPVGTTFGIAVQGNRLDEPSTASVTIIGPGFFMSIVDIWLEPGEVDGVGIGMDENFVGLVYLTDYTESPIVMMGVEGEDADYVFWAQATELVGVEDTLNLGISLDTGEFILNSSENEYNGTYDIHVLRIDDQGFSAFGADGIEIEPYVTFYLQYKDWVENGAGMLVEIDYDDDGYIDDTSELPDTSDEFEWE